ncbi:hypothetical protein V9L20_03685 [Variovorax sp. CCNWLW225]|uniref:hypothetical protein n=1 Tax=Variovorax sp. CCNWLW225 TaxID=3127462 RepID=UPI003077810C
MHTTRWIWTAALCLGMQAAAQADQRVYQQLVCRDNDPFVFCTQGCKDQDKNWTPLDPIAGSWNAVPGYCPWPSTYCVVGPLRFGSDWTQTAVTAVFQYMSICPAAHRQGQWKGSGRPESTPYEH